MNHAAEIWALIAVALLAANLPFANERLFIVGPRRAPKHLGWRLLELLLLFGAVVLVGMAIEDHIGRRHVQGWQFYVALGCLFLTFAFPGFVWRYLRRGRDGGASSEG
jgi:hypothetical protein